LHAAKNSVIAARGESLSIFSSAGGGAALTLGAGVGVGVGVGRGAPCAAGGAAKRAEISRRVGRIERNMGTATKRWNTTPALGGPGD
jgi:hypothetical protein